MRTKAQVLEIVRRLEEAYPLAECTLDYKKDYELLFSVRLAGAVHRCARKRDNAGAVCALFYAAKLCRG